MSLPGTILEEHEQPNELHMVNWQLVLPAATAAVAVAVIVGVFVTLLARSSAEFAGSTRAVYQPPKATKDK